MESNKEHLLKWVFEVLSNLQFFVFSPFGELKSSVVGASRHVSDVDELLSVLPTFYAVWFT